MDQKIVIDGEQPLGSVAALTFKIATEDWEFEQIHRLNYKTFVEEIPQHERNPRRTLIDQFHSENTYIICLQGHRLLGMVAARGKRPFSLDHKLDNLDSYLPPGLAVCEIRLLAIEKECRNGKIFKGVLTTLVQYCLSRGYDLAIISGAVREKNLYEHLGFVPFGPLVGTSGASYQPMYRRLGTVKKEFKRHFRSPPAYPSVREPVNLLPGPVGISQQVRNVFGEMAVSHRSREFVEDFRRTKRLLCQLTGARRVEILMGSGTLANDVIAGQLSLIPGPGLILSNGEFGDRLIDHASRLGLPFESFGVNWGDAFDRANTRQVIDRFSKTSWLWAVHCETSTGVLNDMETLKELCAERDIRLCMDCISSIGTVPVDLRGVYLASGVSGKGLGAFAGLSMVFYNHEIRPEPRALARYLDLGLHAEKKGVPFTISSNLVYALEEALKRFRSKNVFNEINDISAWIRCRLSELGFHVIAPPEYASPAVITIELPKGISSAHVGRRLEEAGFLLSYNSEYLLRRNWIQICLMGECSREAITCLLDMLCEFRPPHHRAQSSVS